METRTIEEVVNWFLTTIIKPVEESNVKGMPLIYGTTSTSSWTVNIQIDQDIPF